MRYLVLLALLAIACVRAAPTDEPILDPNEKEEFLTALKVLKSTALATDVDPEHKESEEREKNAVLKILDKLESVALNDEWDQFNVEDGEETLFFDVMDLLYEISKALIEESGGVTKREARAPIPRRLREAISK